MILDDCWMIFLVPSTKGWHALSDHGWEPLRTTATLELPLPSGLPCGRKSFHGSIGGWNYRYTLCGDGTGKQTNLSTEKERQVKWFGDCPMVRDIDATPSTGSASRQMREALSYEEFLESDDRQMRAEALYESEAVALRLKEVAGQCQRAYMTARMSWRPQLLSSSHAVSKTA